MSWSRKAEWLGIAAGVGVWAASFLAAAAPTGSSTAPDARQPASVAMDPMFVRPVSAGVSGKVVDDSGSPVPGAVVYVYPRSHSQATSARGYVTDTWGRFAVPGLEPGHYSFVTVHKRAASGEPDVAVFGRRTPVELVLEDNPTGV